MAVVAGEIDLVPPRHRREPHRAVGEELPQLLARAQVERGDFVRVVEADEHALAEHDRLEDAVVSHEVLIERVVPDLDARRVLPGPLQVELWRQLLRRGGRAHGIVAPHRPIGGVKRCGRGKQHPREEGSEPRAGDLQSPSVAAAGKTRRLQVAGTKEVILAALYHDDFQALISKMTSTSTAAPVGNCAKPSALRAW